MNILLPDNNQLLRIFQKAVNKNRMNQKKKKLYLLCLQFHLISNGTFVLLLTEMLFGFVCYDRCICIYSYTESDVWKKKNTWKMLLLLLLLLQETNQ